MDWCLARPREEAGLAFMHKIVFVSLHRPHFYFSLIASRAPPPVPRCTGRRISTPLCQRGRRGLGGVWRRRRKNRNDLVLNFNNTFPPALQSTSNQGLNWICNVCLVTHKSLPHQTDSLRAGKQMSVCAPLPLSGRDCVYYY